MSNSAYWNSQYNYYMTNKPPKPESYYNKSFVDRMNEAQKNIDNLVAEKDKSWAAMNQKKDEYDAFNGSMKEYGDVYKSAENEFGVAEAKDTYEKSKEALALAESTLNALPSTINAASNRVLTQSQREARYNALANRQTSYRDNLLARSSAYEDVWRQARENQAEYAKAEIAAQQGKLGDYNNAYVSAMNEYSTAGRRETQARTELSSIKDEYRSWQHQQYANANQVWYANLATALNRYVEALNTEFVQRQAERDKQTADELAQINYNRQKQSERWGDVIANNYYRSQEAEQKKAMASVGGLLGRIAGTIK